MRKIKLLGQEVAVTHNSFPYVRLGTPKDAQQVYTGPGAVLYKSEDGNWYARFYTPRGHLSTPEVLSPVLDNRIEQLEKSSKDTVKRIKPCIAGTTEPPKASWEFLQKENNVAVLGIHTGNTISIHSRLIDYEPLDMEKAENNLKAIFTEQPMEFSPDDFFVNPVPLTPILLAHLPKSSKGKDTFFVEGLAHPFVIDSIKVTGVDTDDSTGILYTFVKDAEEMEGTLKLSENTILGALFVPYRMLTTHGLFITYPMGIEEIFNEGAVLHYKQEDGTAYVYNPSVTPEPVNKVLSALKPVQTEFILTKELDSVAGYAWRSDFRGEDFKRGLSLVVGGVFTSKVGNRDALVVFQTNKPQFVTPTNVRPVPIEKAGKRNAEYRPIQMSILELPEGVKAEDIEKAKVALMAGFLYFDRKVLDQKRGLGADDYGNVVLGDSTKTVFAISKEGKILIAGQHGFLAGDRTNTVIPKKEVNVTFGDENTKATVVNTHIPEAEIIGIKQIDLGDRIHDVETAFSVTHVPLLLKEKEQTKHLNALYAFVFRGEKGTYLAVKGVSLPIDYPLFAIVTSVNFDTGEEVGEISPVISGISNEIPTPQYKYTHYIHLPDKDAIIIPRTSFHSYFNIDPDTRELYLFEPIAGDVVNASSLGPEAGITVILPNYNKAFIITPPKKNTHVSLPSNAIPLDKLAEMFPFKPGKIQVSTLDVSTLKDFVPDIRSHFGKYVSAADPTAMLGVVCKV